MLAQKMEEILERRRVRYTAWAQGFGFDPPPERGGWKVLDAYAEENEEQLERADILSGLKRIDERYGR